MTVYRSVSPGRELDDQQLKPSRVHAIASKIPVPPHIHNMDLCVNLIRLKSGGKNPQKSVRKHPRSPIKRILLSLLSA